MSDLPHSCRPWAEPISLAAAGCLPPDEEMEVRRHLEECSDCRQRFEQLTQLCGTLTEGELPTGNAEEGIVQQVMAAVIDTESSGSVANASSDRYQPGRHTVPLQIWRWMMRSPVSRIAAALIFVVAIVGVALWFHGAGATPALADFLNPILEPKGLRYTTTARWKSLPDQVKILPPAMQRQMMEKGITTEVMMLDAQHTRSEAIGLDGSKTVNIRDAIQGKTLCLIPAEKRATVFDDENPSENSAPEKDPSAFFRALLLDVKDAPGVQHESLGEKEIDGHPVVGVRLRLGTGTMTVWGEPKTGLPVRIEATMEAVPNMTITMSDFEFNVPMDESLFSVEPPPDYELGSYFIRTPTMEIPRPGSEGPAVDEDDLIEMFREYSRLSGGPFPASVDMESITSIVMTEFNTARMQQPGAREEVAAVQAKLQPGLMFRMGLPEEADVHYAGKGVSLGDADKPIFWYRPKDSKSYRVIYADLSVADADTPPSMPVMLPEQDLIDMLRYYTEVTGGAFPDWLKLESLSQGIVMKRLLPGLMQGKRQNPTPEMMQEVMRIMSTKLSPGYGFVNSLPPEADAHYAGRGVSFGEADRPIFWYRPQDSKRYRVIYADLTVRDADTAPDIPIAAPEQDLIDALRYFCEWNGGKFPGALDSYALDPILKEKFPMPERQQPDAEQTKEIIAMTLKFTPGVIFVQGLSPEADAHYAGKGVSLDSPDTPIFWYRPKDAKNYRVVYADLSVRDATSPPNLPEAQPLPTPTHSKE